MTWLPVQLWKTRLQLDTRKVAGKKKKIKSNQWPDLKKEKKKKQGDITPLKIFNL